MDIDTLKRLMGETGTKQKDIAVILDLSPDMVSKTLKGTRLLKAAEADTLRRFFGERADPSGPRPRQLPIVGLISAGAWREGFEAIMGYMPSPDASLSRDAFVVVLSGDSMDLIARDGEAIIVDPADRELISGKLYVVRNSEGETTFKRYRDNPARLEPVSSNKDHQPIYPGQDAFEVIGRAKKRVSDL